MTPIEVLSVASEIYPLIKTGGLADVAGALPGALRSQHVTVRTLVPGYPALLKALRRAETALVRDDLFGGVGQKPTGGDDRRTSMRALAAPTAMRRAWRGRTTPCASPPWPGSAPISPRAG